MWRAHTPRCRGLAREPGYHGRELLLLFWCELLHLLGGEWQQRLPLLLLLLLVQLLLEFSDAHEALACRSGRGSCADRGS